MNASGLGLDNASTLIKVEVMQVLALLDGPAAVAAVNEKIAVAGMRELSDEAHGAVGQLIWARWRSGVWLLKKRRFRHYLHSSCANSRRIRRFLDRRSVLRTCSSAALADRTAQRGCR